MAARARALPTAAPAQQLPELPEAAVACILRHLPLQQRLTRCAFVCSAWAAAVVAVPAVVTIQIHDRHQPAERCRQLQGWLSKHGSVVEELTAKGDDHTAAHPSPWRQPLLQLPVHQFTQLRSMSLSYIKAQLPGLRMSTRGSFRRGQGSSLTGPAGSSGIDCAASSSSGGGSSSAAVVLPQLQELRLTNCCLTLQLVSQFLSVTTLTQLQWEEIDMYDSKWTKPIPQEHVFPTLWQHLQLLPKLSALQLAGSLTSANITLFSNLQPLQHLTVSRSYSGTAAAVAAAAPPGLTALDLEVDQSMWYHNSPWEARGDVVASHLSGLSNLQCLRSAGVRMQPSALGAVTRLKELRLQWPRNAEGSRWSPRELLAALQPFTQLRHLQLKSCGLNRADPELGGDGSYQCFSALTASTQLTALFLADYPNAPVPQAAFEHVFPLGHVLPHLKTLSLTSSVFFKPGLAACVEAAQVARIAASCPALQEVNLQRVTPVDGSFDVSCLAQLPPGVKTVKGLDWTRDELAQSSELASESGSELDSESS